jgi:chorismate dehydratase
MPLRLGLTSDIDFAPLFFPLEAGWAGLPNGVSSQTDDPARLEKALLAGQLDIAPVNPVLYATHTASLSLLPYPVKATDLAADSIFFISTKRPDQLDQARVAVSPNSQTGEALLKILAPKYYGLTPRPFPVASEAAALEALQGMAETCIISGEAAMRAAGWAKAKGHFVEDLTKAWWISTGLPLPTYLLAVRKEWTRTDPEATNLSRSLMLAFRRAIQSGQEQRPTLLDRAASKTGLPVEALDDHYRLQRYELNEAHLRGLLEFYRRAAAQGLIPPLEDLDFFPTLAPIAAAPPQPPRRSQPEAPRPLTPRPAAAPQRPALERVPDSESLAETAEEDSPADSNSPSQPEQPRRSGSRRAAVRAEAKAKGLRVIKGGKDTSGASEEEEF